jgi:hypothetical protein
MLFSCGKVGFPRKWVFLSNFLHLFPVFLLTSSVPMNQKKSDTNEKVEECVYRVILFVKYAPIPRVQQGHKETKSSPQCNPISL